MRPRSVTLRPAAALALVLLSMATVSVPSAPAQTRSGFEYNGIVHVSWWINEYNNFDQPTGQGTDSRVALANTRANWAAVLVTWYQNDAAGSITSPVQPGIIFRRPAPHIQNEEPKTPSDEALRVAIRELHARGLRVMLKPHVDAVNNAWRGDFSPSNLDGWFQSYTQFISHYAQLAQDEGVEAFVMGTEFRNLSGSANRNRWIAVISAVRSLYTGVLTYAANATFPGDEFTQVSFWDQLDVIGLDAYFNLTDSTNPTQAQLIAAWTSNRFGENAVQNVQNLASAHQKPVIFTELGYKSVDGANREPWNFGLGGAVDPGEQRDCYEAAFTVWSTRTSFMKGIMWWAWPVPPPQPNDTDYNPRGKLAEATLRDWQGPAGPSFALAASPGSLTINQGAAGSSTIGITRSGGFTGAVALSASGLPAGVTAAFSPASATGGSSTLTLSAASTAATGSATVTITGTGGGLTRTTTVGLTVNPSAGFTLAANPPTVTATQGGASGATTISITRTGGFTSAVALSASGLPAGVTASFNPASVTGSNSTLTLTASSTAATGSATVTVTGSGGGLTRTTTLTLVVNPTFNFTLAANPGSLTINQGATGTSTINITRNGGFAAAVALSASGLPAGVTATFTPASATGAGSTLSLAASSTATTGSATVTVTGMGGGLTRTTTVSLTVNPGATANFTLAANPSSLAINQGATGSSTIGVTRSGGFTGAVALSASGLPAGVTATFNPPSATGASSTLTLAASTTAATGPATVTITGAGGGLTRTASLALTVNGGGGGTGGVTVTPVIATASPWYNEQDVQLNNTAPLTALSVTIVVQRTAGIGLNGQFNTVGGQVLQSATVTASTITYQFTLAAGQTLGTGPKTFAAQTSGTGTAHPMAGDTYTVTYTTGGVMYSQSGHF